MNHKQFLTLRASAGSGKTFSLTLRYLSLLFLGTNPNEILTITFTKKATKEMKERIIHAIKDLSPQSEILAQLCFQYNFKEKEILEKAPKILDSFIHSSPKIKTIDSFLNSIVKKFCWYIGLSQRYEIQEYNIDEIIEIFLQSLDDNQKKDFSSSFAEFDIKASLLEDLSFHDAILQYQNIDSCPLREELKVLEGQILALISGLKKQIQSHPLASDRAKNAIKDSLKENLEKSRWINDGCNYHYFKRLHLNPTLLEEIREKVKIYYELKNDTIIAVVAQMIIAYKRAKEKFFQQKRALSHDDISQKAKEILTKNQDRDFFYFRLDDRISHILIDEFQDTNPLQYEIFLPLIDEIKAGEGTYKNRSLFFVGDPKQSIYGFRGADSRIFEEVVKYTQEENLPYNFRSQKRIVDFNNEYFSQIFGQDYFPQKSSKQEEKGFIKVYDPIKDSTKNKNKIIETEVFGKILESIQMLLKKSVLPGQITILCHKNEEIIQIKNFLEDNLDIAISTQQSLKISSMSQVQVLIHCLRYSQAQDKFKPYYQKIIAKLLGEDFDSEVIIPQPQGTLANYFFMLMRHFKLCDRSAKQALEIAFSHHEIDAFISQLQATTAKNQESTQNITIMTIHGSKGLEFDHVIYCDRLSSARSQHSPFLIEEDRILFRQKNHELFNATYAAILEKNKQARQKEEKNLMYVAFTRAKKSLFIIPVILDNSPSVPPPVSMTIGEIEADHPQDHPLQSLRLESIYQKAYGKQNYISDQQDQSDEVREQDTLFGQALHLGFEYVPYLKDSALFETIQNQYGFYIDSISEILMKINHLNSQEHFKTLIADKTAFHEISYMDQYQLYRIDLLLIGKDKVIAVDYKSGREKPEHHQQVQNYLSFIQKKFPTKQVEGYIVYASNHPRIQAISKHKS